MLIDLLSNANLVSYNYKVAQLFGLHTAIYLAELLNINDKAIKKNKLSEGYFDLKREYITERTTLTTEEQLSIETNLVKLEILERVENSNLIRINLDNLIRLMSTTDSVLIEEVQKVSKRKNKRLTKEESIKFNLKKLLDNVTNEELKLAYSTWIDSVYIKFGWMTKKAVEVAMKTIDEYTHRDLDMALKILEIASVNGYKDIHWAIVNYEKNYKLSYRANTTINKVATNLEDLSSEVF